ncbi:MAG: helicase-related protein, partial [Bacteroidales bacterium]|nr:helicase-related protein [Bacteroidales bacterium]
NTVSLSKGQAVSRNQFLHRLTDALYFRSDLEFKRGSFRVKGDVIDVFAAYQDVGYRIVFWGDEIEEMYTFDPVSGGRIAYMDQVNIYPANIFVTTQERMQQAIRHIQDDMVARVDYFNENGQFLEARRLQERVEYDLEMIRELGYCSGIENYSRYFDGRSAGTRPFCLLDYFPKDFIMIIDESHVTIPQIRAMYGGDRSRKEVLVDYGFRLPAAIDNRPLKFEEFEVLTPQTIYVSATPADYELEKSEGVIVEQLIRPTGLLDPPIEVYPTKHQVDHLVEQIRERAVKEERILVTTLTKRMAEELTAYLGNVGIRCRYIHSDVETLERVQIMEDLRAGRFDVLVGVNLLREGLDLPEVSLVAILDADKEGFLRSARSLTQTAGRAGRNLNGKVIFYADKITPSMKITLEETNRRRAKQKAFNELHGIEPRQIQKALNSMMGANTPLQKQKTYIENEEITLAADPVIQYMDRAGLLKAIDKVKKSMQKAAKDLEFLEAARLRDEMYAIQKILSEKYPEAKG